MLRSIRSIFLLILLAASFVMLCPSTVLADSSFGTSYSVDYYLGDHGSTIKTTVKLTTTITNREDNVYIDKYSVAFPKSFLMSNIHVTDDRGVVDTKVDSDPSTTTILMNINDAPVGIGKTTKLYLTFDQENLFQVNGNVWEVLLPTMQKEASDGDYTIRVHLPPNDKKLSIAKPKPTSISQDTITWVNPTKRTIIAVFGDRQAYNMKLKYHLQNDRLVPVVTDVAYPPNTSFQHILVTSIDPAPESVSMDSDGNYLGRYRLNPKEQKDIVFRAQAQIFVEPQEQEIARDKERFEKQATYLTKQTSYWNATAGSGTYKNVGDVYRDVVSRLSYNFDRVSDPSTKRLGASQALATPKQAVCAEFTDSFVSLARSIGIPAREMEGYGFSQDERLRPLSLDGDVLHAWPEYWEEKAARWEQIDPTWENTSGVDYFDSFDLNHIVFAIHAKEDAYPVPAGMYKITDSHDVEVVATSTLLSDSQDIQVDSVSLPASINDHSPSTGTVRISNRGRSFAYKIPIQMSGTNVAFTTQSPTIDELAPYQSVDVPFQFSSSRQSNIDQVATIRIKAGASVITKSLTIISYAKFLIILAGLGILGIIALAVIIISLRKHKNTQEPDSLVDSSPMRPIL